MTLVDPLATTDFAEFTANFVTYVTDPGDIDKRPDAAPVQGTVTFTPSVSALTLPSQNAFVLTTSYTFQLDADGSLASVGPNGTMIKGVKVPATNLAAATVTNSTYHVTFNLSQGRVPLSFPAFNVTAQAGTVVDLSTVAPAQASSGVYITRGPAGPQGIPGQDSTVPGPQGPAGPAGAASTVPGPQGPAGPQGLQGPKGDTGAAGATGPQGAQGLQGPKGDTGAAGATGPQGAQGLQGPKGDTGAAGQNGTNGAAGPVGPQGIQGPAGAGFHVDGDVATFSALPSPAPSGQFYVTTDTGHLYISNGTVWNDQGAYVGPVGPQGIQGAQGIQGPAGPKGDTGAAGPQGVQGLTGATGADGATGPAGPQGIQGLKGDTGATGAVGATGPQGVQGLTGATGPAGADGAIGPTGPAGPQGSVGQQGIQGVAGSAGATGPTGPANTLDVISTTTLAAGSAATVTVTGAAPTQHLAFGIPAGAQGPAGPTGPQGATGPAGPTGATGPAGSSGEQTTGWWHLDLNLLDYNGQPQSGWVEVRRTENLVEWVVMAGGVLKNSYDPIMISGNRGMTPSGAHNSALLFGGSVNADMTNNASSALFYNYNYAVSVYPDPNTPGSVKLSAVNGQFQSGSTNTSWVAFNASGFYRTNDPFPAAGTPLLNGAIQV